MNKLYPVSLLAGAFILASAGSPVRAETCSLTYEIFEFSVAHLDLDECPNTELADAAFCRANIGSDEIHVYYFSNEDDQCLLKVESYSSGDYSLTFHPRQKTE